MAEDFTPRRVVSLQPSATVILTRLGLADRIVACTRYCREVCPEIAGKTTIVADSWTAQAAEILAGSPDLVIAAVPYQVEAIAEILKAGIRFLGLAPKTLADIYTDIAAIAGVMGAGDRAQEIVAGMRRDIAAVRERHASLPRLRVFAEEWGKPIIASQPWVAELVAAAGGEMVGQPGARTDAATVSASDPDVILMAWCGAGDRVPLEKVVRDRGWEALRAVRKGQVYCISDELLNTPAPTLVAGLAAISSALHPELYPGAAPGLRRIRGRRHQGNDTPW